MNLLQNPILGYVKCLQIGRCVHLHFQLSPLGVLASVERQLTSLPGSVVLAGAGQQCSARCEPAQLTRAHTSRQSV